MSRPPVTPRPNDPVPVPWYHQKWFVVLVLIVFFPAGIILLWTSPLTKMSGRIVWSAFWLLAVIAVWSPSDDVAPVATGPAASDQPAPRQAPSAPEPPEEYPYRYSRNGQTFKGKIASEVGVAVLDTLSETSLSSAIGRTEPNEGAVFIVVKVAVNNEQKDAIMMDSNLFKILSDGREYSASSEASLSLMMADKEALFLKQINPGLTVVGAIAFEVPATVDVANAELQFRGGVTGRIAKMPLRPITE